MNLKGKVHYVGVNDRVKHRFEGLWFLPQGVSYNSYLIDDEKGVALVDTVDVAFFAEFLDKIKAVIGDRPIDYLIVNHMEPDHSGALALIRKYYPNIRLIGNKKTFEMVQGYYGACSENDIVVTDGDSLDLGHHKLRFYLTPMLHWPETMMTYCETDKILFSGDAFGCFGALNGNIIDMQMDTDDYWPEMERYYAAILGKFGAPVQAGLKKLGGLELQMICSTHGPVWVKEIQRAIDTYHRFSAGITQRGLVICYGSMYGNTEQMAERIARELASRGVGPIVMYNLSFADESVVLRDVFRYDTLIVGAPTYNGGIYPPAARLLDLIAARCVPQRNFGWFGSFCWAGAAVRGMGEFAQRMKWEPICDPVEMKQGFSSGCRFADGVAERFRR